MRKNNSIQGKKEVRKSYRSLSQNELIEILAHDLRVPISNIINLSEMLVINDTIRKNDQKISDYIGYIRLSAEQAMDIVINSLEWNINHETLDTNEPNQISKTINTLIDGFRAFALCKNIEIFFSQNAVFDVKIELSLLKTVLRNLISNAIKFTPVNGKVMVSVKDDEKHLEFCIGDTGIGISKEKIKNIFEGTVQTLGTEKEEGTGAGLKICKNLIEKSGGAMWVESTVNKGSNFYFTLMKY